VEVIILKPSDDQFLEPQSYRGIFATKLQRYLCHKVAEVSFEQLESECNIFRRVVTKEFSDKQDKLHEKALKENLKQWAKRS
jgi:hypothetical protein